MIDLASGDLGRAVELAQRGVQLAREIRATRFIVYNLGALAAARRELEDASGASQMAREALSLAGKIGGAWKPWILAGLVLDSIELAQLGAGQRYLAEGRADLARTPTRVYFPQELLYAEGHLALARGDSAAAAEAARQLAALVKDTGTAQWSPLARLLDADVAWSATRAHAADLYAEVDREAERLGRLPLRWRALAARAEVEDALGRRLAARENARVAKEIIDRIAAGVADEPLRTTFLQSRRVQRVTVLAGA
jgi:hypothetical protein